MDAMWCPVMTNSEGYNVTHDDENFSFMPCSSECCLFDKKSGRCKMAGIPDNPTIGELVGFFSKKPSGFCPFARVNDGKKITCLGNRCSVYDFVNGVCGYAGVPTAKAVENKEQE